MADKKNKKASSNPIDADKITDNPGGLIYPHSVGSAPVKPNDTKRIKKRGYAAMQEQTDQQLNQIREQIELLAKQADTINRRKELSAMIYAAEINFEPDINYIYHLYRKENGVFLVSLIAPDEWRKCPYEFLTSVRLLADRTWEEV